jgi:hypothetical protein
MKKNNFRKTFFGWKALPFWLALATFGLVQVFSARPQITERVYSQTIYPVFASVLSFFSRWLSFSLDDSFYAALVVFLVVLILLMLFRKIRFAKFALIFFQALAICFTLFYWFWGFNYFRESFNQRFGIQVSRPDTVQFARVLGELVQRTNESWCTFDDFTHRQADSLIEASYRQHASFLKIDYPQGKRRPKPITLRNFFAQASIAGYYGPFFSEVHINDSLLNVEYPQVVAHEFAHQFGITSEAEANFYSWLVCTRSGSKQLQYSANLSMLGYFLSQSKHLHGRVELIRQIQKPVLDDMRKIQDRWVKLRNEKVDKVAEKVNDAYLKTNKIEKGVEDYFGVVQLVMDFETDSLAAKRVGSRGGQ